MDAYEVSIRGGQTRLMTVKARASGAGQSKLLHQFFEWVNHQPEQPMYLHGVGVPREQRQGRFALLRELFAAQFDLQAQDSLAQLQHKIEQGVAALIPTKSRALAHFLGYLLGFDFSNSPHIAALRSDPAKLEQFGRESVVHFLTELAHEHPVLIHLEDIQWADTESVRLLNQLVAEQPHLRLLLICRLVEREEAPTSSTARPPRPSQPISIDRLRSKTEPDN
jgi:predicted ATPase